MRRSLRNAVQDDVGRAIHMAAGGALVFAPIEYVATFHAYAGHIHFLSKLRLIALVATLSLWLAAALLAMLIVVILGARLVRVRIDPATVDDPGLFALGDLEGGTRPGVARLWSAVMTAMVTGVGLQRAAVWAMTHYKEPQLTAGLIAAIGLGALVAAPLFYRATAGAIEAGALALATIAGGRLAGLNPLGRWRAAGAALAALVLAGLAVVWFALPQSRSVLPVRLTISAITIATGLGLGALRHTRTRLDVPDRSQRRRARILAGATFAVVVLTLFRWGADLETKYVAITASPALGKLVTLVQITNDFDFDGYGSVLGDNDCGPFDNKIHPNALDRPGNDIDENCDGRDAKKIDLQIPPGEHIPVPAEFQKPWNVLFITIDTVRYDHTTFGGYKDAPKHRDTTPRLAELAAKSVSFAFANAPSAGTMASIPAILTSKYFHSGIALDEKRPPGTPPKILPENTTLPEIMKRAHYTTGVIASHEWWNDWGLDQGVDEYDNSIGKTPDPFRVAADKVSNSVLAWVSRHQSDKWFLWAHYIDPHGRYVAHPDVVDYGSTEPDLYDAEIRWTDQEIGKLLDSLARLPSNDHTIIIITSDHGDSMGEHNVPVGTHGTALYYELQHVPLIVYIPNNPPRVIHGAVTNLDVVPTVAELCGIDVHDLSFEGRSLVPQLFYGKEDHDRIVFAETNAPGKQRAAINEHWKLIYYLSTNLTELFDLDKDPGEHTNLAPQNPPELAIMREALDAWMQRVLFMRDPLFNQAFRQMQDVLLGAAPTPAVGTPGKPTLAAGAVEALGVGVADGKTLVPNGKADVWVYLHALRPTTGVYRFQLVVWPMEAGEALPVTPANIPGSALRSTLRVTADGAYPSDQWKANDFVRERFPVEVRPWTQPQMGVAVTAAGPAPGDETTVILGALPLGSQPPPTP